MAQGMERLEGPPEERARRGELVLRTLPVMLIPVLVTLLTWIFLRFAVGFPPEVVGANRRPPSAILVPLVGLIVFFTALIVLVRVGRPRISALVLIAVWTLETTVQALQGGVTAIWPALLLLPICAAGLLIDGVASLSLTVLATVLVGSIGWMEWSGYVFENRIPPFMQANMPVIAVGYWVSLFWSVAALTYLLAGSLQRALHQSRGQAEALQVLSTGLEERVARQTAELGRRAAQAEALYEVSRALAGTLPLPEVLRLITEQAARLLRFHAAVVLLASSDADEFDRVGAASVEIALRGEALEEAARQVMASGRPAVMRLDGDGERAPLAVLVLPLRYGGEIEGVLALLDEEGRAERVADDLALAEGFADQAAVAIANARLLEQAREAATLEERTRLARDIHDTLAQGLTGVVVQLGAAQRALAAAPEEATEHLTLAQRLARDSLAEARRSVWNLRAPALERGELSDALHSLASSPLAAGTGAVFREAGLRRSLPVAVESALLRVAQEALANIAKHAHARAVSLELAYLPSEIQLTVRDDGVGFDPQVLATRAAPGPWGGFGLLGMRERMSALGGSLELESHPGGGTTVIARVPEAR